MASPHPRSSPASIHGGGATLSLAPRKSNRRQPVRFARALGEPAPCSCCQPIEPAHAHPVNYLGEDLGTADEAIMSTAPVSINVSMDSGAIAHVAGPDMLPAAAVKTPARVRSFRAANGGLIAHHGTARVAVVGDKMPWKQALMEFEAADVNRALQSTGATCDKGKEVLFTKDACYVVAAGLLSPIIKRDDVVQAFRREPNGGLYTRAVQVSVPASASPQTNASPSSLGDASPGQTGEPAQTFPRPGGH